MSREQNSLPRPLEKFRLRRQGLYQRLFSSRALCIAGLLIMPALLFNPDTVSRILQFFFFWFLAWLSGKKNNPLITILVILGIAAFNLLVPYGRVIVSLGVFKITTGALLAGIHRGVTLEALIMLSRVTIRQDLRLPGSFGELIGESFRIFAQIMERKNIIDRKNIAASIDKLMIELSEVPSEPAAAEAGAETQQADSATQNSSAVGGIIILIFAVILSWVPLGLQIFYRLTQS
jgi:heptaprenyl diphosphate synthase